MIAEYTQIGSIKRLETSTDFGLFNLQTQANLTPDRAVVTARNMEICQLSGMQQLSTYDLSVNFVSGGSYLLKFWSQSSNLGKIKSLATIFGQLITGNRNAIQDAVMPKIFDNAGQEVGEVGYVPIPDDNVNSYDSWWLQLRGQKIDCYVVGIDHTIHLCMYDSTGEMIATVEKTIPVKHRKSQYLMFISRDDLAQAVIVMTAILHHQLYFKLDMQGAGLQAYSSSIFQGKHHDKYRPDFVERFKAM